MRTIILALLVSGCAAHKLYKEGVELEQTGAEYQAAGKYLAALDKNADFAKAHEALVAVAAKAYDEELGRAKSAEDNKDYPTALTEYTKLKRFLDRLNGEDAVTFTPINVRGKMAEMQNSAAQDEYVDGEKELAARRWDEAIAHYQAAQGFKEGYKDSDGKIATAYYGWGEEDAAAHRFRDAAGHYGSSVKQNVGGAEDAAAKGSAIYAALGRYFLSTGYCRAAVRDLQSAKDLTGATELDSDLASANACAITPVAILPFDNPTGINVAGMALGDALSDQIGAKVSSDGSTFVHLVERTALNQLLAEQGLSASGVAGTATSKLTGVRYLVIGKFTQVALDHPAPTVTQASAPGRNAYECTKTNSSGAAYKTTCYNDVTVSYRAHSAREALTVSGSVRVVDVKTGEQLCAPALSATAQDKADWAEGFSVGSASVDVVPDGRTGGIVVADSLVTLSQGRQTLSDDSNLATAVLKKLATDAAKAVLGAVDVEKTPTDPSTLTIAGGK